MNHTPHLPFWVSPGNRTGRTDALPAKIFLAFLLVCGIFLRFSDLSTPLLDFHPTRQLFGAIKARGIYYDLLTQQKLGSTSSERTDAFPALSLSRASVPTWQKDLALRQYSGEATIEPPLLEHLSATLFTFFGEQTAIPRAISATFWLFGGLFLFLLSKNLTGSFAAATFGLAFYLLTPYAVSASRAFQPDPLMILLLLIFWWSIENWGRHTAWKWTFIAGISGGLAIFVKFPAAFFVIGAAFGAIFAHIGFLKSLKLHQTWVIILLGILPPGAYLYYGTFVDKFLDQQFGGRFYPDLWISPFFYLRWFLKLENVVSTLWITLALLGWLVFSSKTGKIFIGSLWGAYLVFGMTFAYHISSHDYYSLPLIPITAIGLASLAAALLPIFGIVPVAPGYHPDIVPTLSWDALLGHRPDALLGDKPQGARLAPLLISAILLLNSVLFITLDQYLRQRTSAADYRQQAAFWAEIGSTIGHQPGVVALTTDYGYPLAYYGWQNSTPWPLSLNIKSFNETFTELTANKSYFLITDFDEYQRQPDLEKLLNTKYPVLAQTRGFIIFDLAHSKK